MPAVQSRLRFIVFSLLIASLAIAVACGGDDGGDNGDDGNNGGGSSPTSTPDNSSSGDDDDDSDDGDNDSNDGTGSSTVNAGTAVVTIGEKRYEFEMAGQGTTTQCLTVFGVVGGSGRATDGSDVTLSIEILPEDWATNSIYEEFDPPSIRVDDDELVQDWRAGDADRFDFDESIAPRPGESQVGSYTNDGKSASGTATFLDMDALFQAAIGQADRPEPVEGTFEINCE